jgi:3-oxoacyl-[acyl-carrier protein] reductase
VDLGISGRRALITGGNRGIGRAIALMLAAEGCHVAVCGRDSDRLRSTEAEIRAQGVTGAAIRADLFQAADCERTVSEAVAALGGLEILINNASTDVSGRHESLIDLSDDVLTERIRGKAMAAIRVSRAAIPHLLSHGWGRVIFIGGTSARHETSGPADGASIIAGLGNAMVARFAKYLSRELAPGGVTVNVVHPHSTLTERHAVRVKKEAEERGVPLAVVEGEFASGIFIGRPLVAEDVAAMAVFLASARAGAISGQSIAVDGGSAVEVVY